MKIGDTVEIGLIRDEKPIKIKTKLLLNMLNMKMNQWLDF